MERHTVHPDVTEREVKERKAKELQKWLSEDDAKCEDCGNSKDDCESRNPFKNR